MATKKTRPPVTISIANAPRSEAHLAALTRGNLIRLAIQLHLLDTEEADTAFKVLEPRQQVRRVLDALQELDARLRPVTDAEVNERLRRAEARCKEYEAAIAAKNEALRNLRDTLAAADKEMETTRQLLSQADPVYNSTPQPPQERRGSALSELAARVLERYRAVTVKSVALRIQYGDGIATMFNVEP